LLQYTAAIGAPRAPGSRGTPPWRTHGGHSGMNMRIDTERLSARPATLARENVPMANESQSARPGLMQGKRGLIMGVANDHSIAWGIAKMLAAQGAELAFTYQGEALGKRVKPLAQQLGSDILLPCDVEDIATVDAAFEAIGRRWGSLDFLVHAIAFSDKSELKGRYADTTRENFVRTMVISCFSFTEVAKRAAALMPNGGSIVTLTYGGSTRVMPNYNVMGVAKAALEASVRYLASDFGPQAIRVNAISAGPVRTLAGAGIADARLMFNFQKRHAPLRRTVTIEEVGGAAVYLLSDLSTGVTGDIHFVDSGYNIVSMPQPAALRTVDEAETAAEVQAAADRAER
jgi:enoyl-[acyl-carrier protein] reductase I